MMTAIRQIRKSKNLTQAELAAMIETTSASISRYETGDRVPDLETAARIAKALGCKVDDLIDK